MNRAPNGALNRVKKRAHASETMRAPVFLCVGEKGKEIWRIWWEEDGAEGVGSDGRRSCRRGRRVWKSAGKIRREKGGKARGGAKGAAGEQKGSKEEARPEREELADAALKGRSGGREKRLHAGGAAGRVPGAGSTGRGRTQERGRGQRSDEGPLEKEAARAGLGEMRRDGAGKKENAAPFFAAEGGHLIFFKKRGHNRKDKKLCPAPGRAFGGAAKPFGPSGRRGRPAAIACVGARVCGCGGCRSRDLSCCAR